MNLNIFTNISKYYLSIKLFLYLFLVELLLVALICFEMFNALVISLLIVLSVAIFVEPIIGIFLTIFLSIGIEGRVIEQFVLFRLFGFNWYLMDICLLIVFLSVLIRLASGVYDIKINNILLWLAFFSVACLIGVFWGIRSNNSTQSIFYDLRGFFYYIFFLPAAFLINDYKKLKMVFILVIVIGTLKCLFDSISSLYFLPHTFDLETKEYLSFYRLIGYTEITYPITFVGGSAYFLMSNSLKKRLLLLPVIFISAAALFLSYTRGSWLAAFLSIIALFVFLVITKKVKIGYSNLLIGIVSFCLIILMLDLFKIFSFQEITERVTSVSFNKIDVSNLGRLVEYATALEAFNKNPLLGAGLGFKFTYFAPGIGYESTEYCHNSYLYVMAKMGIVGLLPFLMILLSSFHVGYLALTKRGLDTEESKLIFIFILILMMISIKSFTTWHLNTLTFSPFVGIIFGISYFYKNKIKKLRDKQNTIH